MTIFQKARFLCLNLFASLFLLSCASEPAPLATASIQSDADSFVVIGVDPNNVRVFLHNGNLKDGKFDADKFYSPPIYGPAVDGFIICKLPAGKARALDGAQTLSSPTGTTGLSFWSQLALVFVPQPGKVVYLTSVSYTPGLSRYQLSIVPHFHQDFEGARAFMKKHYPELADKLEQGKFQYLQLE